MKIALIIERLDPLRGGRETSTAQIAEALARGGHEVSVICQQGRWQGQGVEVVRVGRRGFSRLGRLRNFVHAAKAVAERGGYDVVHATLPIPGANVYQPRGGTIPAQQQASYRRRDIVGRAAALMLSRLNFCRKYQLELENQLVRDRNVLCLAVSRMVADEFEQYYGRTDGVRVVFNGVDAPDVPAPQRQAWRAGLRQQLGAGEADMVFLTVATNLALKGVSQAIAAFARWYNADRARRNSRLVVVGSERHEGYQRQAQMRNVGGAVVFVGPTSEIFQWYSAADALVLLSWYDPCSRAVLEATRWGVPSITTIYNGASEVLTRGAGLVVSSPNDIRAVTAAMNDLADPQRRAQRSALCLKAADGLSVESHVQGLLKAYDEAARR